MFGWLKKLFCIETNWKEPEVCDAKTNDVADTGTRFYRPKFHDFDADGTLHLRTSSYDPEGHTSGVIEVQSSHLDYAFWCWLVTRPEYQRSVNETDLLAARAKYKEMHS